MVCRHRKRGIVSRVVWALTCVGFALLLVWGLVDQGMGSLWLTVPLLTFALLNYCEPDDGYGGWCKD